MSLFDGGIYRITNVSTQLPLKPQSPAVNSYLITATDDKSDNFRVGIDVLATQYFKLMHVIYSGS